MHHPAELRYTPSHEWVRLEGNRATIGITDHAQHELGDVVYVDLPSAGKSLSASDVFGTVESVKAVSDLYAPVAGAVVEINEGLLSAPESINQDPYGAGWLVVMEVDPAEVEQLWGVDSYVASLE